MATIKLQPSGNVVIKDGKVSCGCCEGPEGCCPYPAAALVDGLYTYEDLPDAIDIDGIPYTKLDPPVFFGGVTLYYVNLFGEHLQIEDQGPDSTWNFEGGGNACLLNDAGMEDQFADTYSVSGTVSGTVTRTSICTWVGTGLTLSNFGFQFQVNGNNKSGFQNTPEGSYAGGFTVS